MARDLINLLFFPAGLGLIAAGLLYQWACLLYTSPSPRD